MDGSLHPIFYYITSRMMHYIVKNIAWIDVIFAPMQDTTSITIEILVKAGALYETQTTNGLSHFLEHMFFKWGEKYKTPKAVAEAIDNVWWEFNAFTGKEYAGYYVKAAPNNALLALDVLGDMMIHATFPADEIEKEKWVIVQEIHMYKDQPQSEISNIWTRNYFGDNPFWWTILWPETNINLFTQDHFFAHRDSLYAKNNLVIVVAGKILDQQAIEDTIARLFKTLPTTSTLSSASYQTTPPAGSWDIVDQNTHQNHFILGGAWFAYEDQRKYAANILWTIIGGTMSSRLFQKIREEKGLCYYIGGWHSASNHHGIFTIRAGLSKEKYEEGVMAVKDELTTIAQGNITEEEVKKAISHKVWSLQMWIETTDQMADFLWFQYLLHGEIDTIDMIMQKYQSVTFADVKAICHVVDPKTLYGATIH